MPMPFLALARIAPLASSPISDSICSRIRLRLRRRQVDFIDHRNNFEIVMQRQISIGERLRFHALRRIDHQQRAFAGLQAARDFVREIDVSRRIDQVELILDRRFSRYRSGARRAL